MGRKRNTSTHLRGDKGRLRIEWQTGGKRYYLYTGLEDTKSNRVKVSKLQMEIEADLETGQLDPTLAKYKPHPDTGKRLSDLTATELFEEWLQFKSREWDKKTLRLRSYLKGELKFFGDTRGRDLTTSDTQAFYSWMLEQPIEPATFNRKLGNFRSCWEWLKRMHYVTDNPWENLPRLKGKRKKPAEPFTKEEINKILAGFAASQTYSHFLPLVRFMLGTGCRIGEAIGLTWENFDGDRITIAQQYTDGQFKIPKKDKIRRFKLSASIRELLLELKAASPRPQGLIFTWNGKPIDNRNFRVRVWQPILEAAGVDYRKPYNSRHTFCSHSLAAGYSPVQVAAVTGHSARVLFEHYAAVIEEPEAPDIF